MITIERDHPPIIQYLPGSELGYAQVSLTDPALMTTDDVIARAVAQLYETDPFRQDPDLCPLSFFVCSHSELYFIAMNVSGQPVRMKSGEHEEALKALEQPDGSMLLPYADGSRTSVLVDGQVVPVDQLVEMIDKAYYDGLTADIPGGNFGFTLGLILAAGVIVGGVMTIRRALSDDAEVVVVDSPGPSERKSRGNGEVIGDGLAYAQSHGYFSGYTGDEIDPRQAQAKLDEENIALIQRFRVKGIGEGSDLDDGFAALRGIQNDTLLQDDQVIGSDDSSLKAFKGFVNRSHVFKSMPK